MAGAERFFGVPESQRMPEFVQGERLQDVRGVGHARVVLKDDVELLEWVKTGLCDLFVASPPAGKAPVAADNMTPAYDVLSVARDSARLTTAAGRGGGLPRVVVQPAAATSVPPAVRAGGYRGQGGPGTHGRRGIGGVVRPVRAEPGPAHVVTDVELCFDLSCGELNGARKAGKHRGLALGDAH